MNTGVSLKRRGLALLLALLLCVGMLPMSAFAVDVYAGQTEGAVRFVNLQGNVASNEACFDDLKAGENITFKFQSYWVSSITSPSTGEKLYPRLDLSESICTTDPAAIDAVEIDLFDEGKGGFVLKGTMPGEVALDLNLVYRYYDEAGNEASDVQTCLTFVVELDLTFVADYTLIYDTVGGSEIQRETETTSETTYEFTLTDEEPAKVGYIFQGWADSQDGDMVERVTLKYPDTEKTVYAVWEKCDHAGDKSGADSIDVGTCVQPSWETHTCSECGEVYQNNTGMGDHSWGTDWKSNEKNHWHECANDSSHKDSESDHVEDAGTVTRDPTCTVPGVKTFACSVCGYVMRTEEIGKDSHSYGKWVSTGNEQHVHTCTVCGAIETDVHNWDEGEVTTDPSCGKAGVTTYTCSDCGETKTDPAPAATGNHTYGAWTDNNDGTHTGTCTAEGCNATKTEAHNTEGSVTHEDATCTVNGVEGGTYCTLCGNGKTAAETKIPAGHKWGAWKSAGDEQHIRTCTVCGAIETDVHNWDEGEVTTDPSCGKAGVTTYTCNDCGETKTDPAPAATGNHTYGAWTDNNDGTHTGTCTAEGCNATKTEAHNTEGSVTHEDATCTVNGVEGGTYCTLCGNGKTAAETKIPAGHTEVVDEAVAATCTATGLTEGKHCSVCEEVLVAQAETAKLDHTWNDGVVTKAPTATAKGEKTFTCTVCGATRTEEIAATGNGGGNGGGTPVGPSNPTPPVVDPGEGDEIEIGDDGPALSEDPFPFVDVDEDDWFYDAVKDVWEKGLMDGTDPTHFSPYRDTTRAMIVTVLYRMEGEPQAALSPFTDVAAGQWFTDAIGWGAAEDIARGYSSEIFKPGKSVSREELVAFLHRYAQYKGWDVSERGDLSAFTDAGSVAEWFEEDVTWAVGAGLLQGKGNGVLDPKGTAKRSEIAQLFSRFYARYMEEDDAQPNE